MVDPRARRGLPERWLLPPAPRDDPAASRWHALPFEDKRSLARVGPDDVPSLDGDARTIVAELARVRLATRWRLLAAAPVFGWLVLMAVWGFGQSTYPESSTLWLQAGLALGALTWFAAAIAAINRLRQTRAVLAACTTAD
ncbi:MAG: hypothetical protein EA388_12020 [Nitriliruptor sp.]|nr:MAG: hypothetical protein EA388_12020 [Nitriliruptor sp.]